MGQQYMSTGLSLNFPCVLVFYNTLFSHGIPIMEPGMSQLMRCGLHGHRIL
jgi:hypothetical protein